jgi:hypothetical protein
MKATRFARGCLLARICPRVNFFYLDDIEDPVEIGRPEQVVKIRRRAAVGIEDEELPAGFLHERVHVDDHAEALAVKKFNAADIKNYLENLSSVSLLEFILKKFDIVVNDAAPDLDKQGIFVAFFEVDVQRFTPAARHGCSLLRKSVRFLRKYPYLE